MKITFLGTSAAVPTPERGLPCMCIERDGEILMFDAGEGAQSSFAKARLGWNKKMGVFITHMHGDHCLGLLGMLQTMSLRGRSTPLRIYGPRGISDFVWDNMRLLHCTPSFDIRIGDIGNIGDTGEGTIHESNGYRIRACRADHTVPSYAYLLEERDRPGRFNSEEALRLGIPRGPLWGTLQRGQDVVLEGQRFTPGQVLGKSRPGLRIGYSGDTRPTKKLEEFFGNCHYAIFDSTFTEEMAERAQATGHSTAAGAAALARRAGIGTLILTHFSARHADDAQLLSEARRVHNPVMAARDHMSLDI